MDNRKVSLYVKKKLYSIIQRILMKKYFECDVIYYYKSYYINTQNKIYIILELYNFNNIIIYKKSVIK